MPYKDPIKAKENARERGRRYDEKHREERRAASRERYQENPEKERGRIRKWSQKLKTEKRCVNCARPRDREGKTLCSVCAPKFAASVKAYHERTKVACFEAYGGVRCACCGVEHLVFLSIDHINGGGNQHRNQLRQGGYFGGGGGWRMYKHLQREGYPAGYRVLCFNCNQAFSVLGYCPHHPPT